MMQCAATNCGRGPQDDNGSTLYRISPKGPWAEFVGLCHEHYVAWQRAGVRLESLDPGLVELTKIIEEER